LLALLFFWKLKREEPMTKKPNTSGGGAQTNINGLHFEQNTDLKEAVKQLPGYSIDASDRIFKDGKPVAQYFEKHSFYKRLLEPSAIEHQKIISKKLLPDSALLVGSVLYIIEKKYQSGSGSVDEKLQTCDFKKKQYQKLVRPLGLSVQFYFVLNSWFQKAEYRDVFEYIESVDCRYFFNVLPLHEVGLV
jgi:hypothetical protein